MPLELNNQGIESGQLFIYTHLVSQTGRFSALKGWDGSLYKERNS